MQMSDPKNMSEPGQLRAPKEASEQFQDMSANELRQIARKLATCTADKEAQQMSHRCCEVAAVLDAAGESVPAAGNTASSDDIVERLHRACGYETVTPAVRSFQAGATNGLVLDAAQYIDDLERELAGVRAERTEAEASCDRLRAQYDNVREMNIRINGAYMARLFKAQEVIKPFAEFADPTNRLPPDFTITGGSPMAKRQLTMGHCYDAREWIKAAEG